MFSTFELKLKFLRKSSMIWNFMFSESITLKVLFIHCTQFPSHSKLNALNFLNENSSLTLLLKL